MPSKRLHFRREFDRLTGGHLKVWHYFQHACCAPGWHASIHLAEAEGHRTPSPWSAVPERHEDRWDPDGADALFIAGMDWLAVPSAHPKPVINLIQHIRHAVPGDPRRQFLSRAAVRIFVSPQVAEAILATGIVNGPVITIPNGIDASELPVPTCERDIQALVLGYKDAELAASVRDELARRGVQVRCLLHPVPRTEFLDLLARAECVVTIPHEHEGFYLPALEAMALAAIVQCVEEAIRMPALTRRAMLDRGRDTARSMDIAHERSSFHRLLGGVAAALPR